MPTPAARTGAPRRCRCRTSSRKWSAASWKTAATSWWSAAAGPRNQPGCLNHPSRTPQVSRDPCACIRVYVRLHDPAAGSGRAGAYVRFLGDRWPTGRYWPGPAGRGQYRGAGVDLLGRLDHDLLDLILLLGLEADGDGEDAVVVARLHVVRVGVARQRQAAGERAVAELGPVLALGLVVPLGADGQVARADRDLHVLLRVDPGQFGAHHVVVALDEVLDPDRLAQVGAEGQEGLLEPLDQVREHRPRVPAHQRAHLICLPLVTAVPSHRSDDRCAREGRGGGHIAS